MGVLSITEERYSQKLLASIQAISDYQMATRLIPQFADAIYGDMLQKLNRYDEAEDSVRHALALNPGFAIAHASLGAILNKTGRLQEAENCLRAALHYSPELAVAHSNLLFLLASTATSSTDTLYEEQRNWDRIHGREGRMNVLPSRPKEPVTTGGYGSGTFHPIFEHIRSAISLNLCFPPMTNHASRYFVMPVTLSANPTQRRIVYVESQTTGVLSVTIATRNWRSLSGRIT